MKTSRFIFSAMIVVALGMLAAAPAQAVINSWDLVTDWTQTSPNVGSPGVFGLDPVSLANDLWQIKKDDTPANANSFVDVTNAYNPIAPPLGIFYSGYAEATKAVGKFYGTPGSAPGVLPIDPADLIAQPGGYNADAGAGSVDFGDLFAVPGSCCGPAGPGSAVNIWWEAPRNMTIQVQLDTYSVGTQGASIDFGIRGGPGGGPLLDLNLQGGSGPASGNYGAPTPAHTTGPGGARGFNTMIMAALLQ